MSSREVDRPQVQSHSDIFLLHTNSEKNGNFATFLSNDGEEKNIEGIAFISDPLGGPPKLF